MHSSTSLKLQEKSSVSELYLNRSQNVLQIAHSSTSSVFTLAWYMQAENGGCYVLRAMAKMTALLYIDEDHLDLPRNRERKKHLLVARCFIRTNQISKLQCETLLSCQCCRNGMLLNRTTPSSFIKSA